ncbi:MAG TPA: hypothetical protein PLL69_00990 [Gemmatimonadales bacterium]|nr:hypothetical protein [Gemmatimonadales bacterium]
MIYFLRPRENKIYLLMIYSKSDRDDLSPNELRILRQLIRNEE